MSVLLDSLATAFRGDAQRRQSLDAALRDGLPGARSEAWKYTALRSLERRAFAPAAAVAPAFDAALLDGIPAPRMVFVNGRLDPRYSDLDGLPPGVGWRPLSAIMGDDDPRAVNFLQRRFDGTQDVFARLNAALADEGAVLRVDAGVHVERPVHVVSIGVPTEPDVAWHARHLFELRAGAQASVVEHHLAGGAHAHMGNTLAHVHLGRDAQLLHARIQDESARATLLSRTDAVLAAGARYRRVDLELGAGLSRHELNVRLEGAGAQLQSNGVLMAGGRRHLDTRLGIEHVVGDTRSDVLWRGLAAGRGRAVFHGGIVIRAGADGSSADLSNKNLLLGDQAEIDAQPVLEIHADEVKAAHGATVGQLDPKALFYLRSRGLPEAEARSLLTAAFCREVVASVDEPAIRELLALAVDRALPRLEIA